MSSVRRTPLVNGEFYHVFNRGIARAPTFYSYKNYNQAMLSLSYYRFLNPPMSFSRLKELATKEREKILNSLQDSEKLVDIICFVLMPNHFHFLLKQLHENGISKFISQFTNSYTRYFNTARDRVGPLFQGVFKSVHVETNEQLIHLSRYIHLNAVVSNVIREKELFSYPWSSLPDYVSGKSLILQMDHVLGQFKTPQNYKKFVSDYIDYAKRIERIKHLTFEDDSV